MERVVTGGTPSYRVFAIKRRPELTDRRVGSDPLFNAPLPNVGHGGVCWGTVAKPSDAHLKGTSLARDWELLLGSEFGSHNVGYKSLKYGTDIRQMYVSLEGKTRYPVSDLVSANMTVAKLLQMEES
jgi:hypothetical protein